MPEKNIQKWDRRDEGTVYLTKEYSPEIYIKLYLYDARWHFVICGRVNTKYKDYRVGNANISRMRRGWKNLSNAKERALYALHYYREWYEEYQKYKQKMQV